MKHRIAAIPDDGIGKEVVPEGRRVLGAAIQFAAAPTPPRSSARAASRQDAVDAEPGMPEAGVGVGHFPFAPRVVAA
jgi:hypothetical protein